MWYKQLGNKVTRLGRQLGGETSQFGRQLSTVASKVTGGLGKAQHFVSNVEKATSHIPVVGGVAHVVGDVLGGAKNLAQAGVIGGNAITQLGQGHVKQSFRTAEGLGGLAKNTLNLGKDALGTGVKIGAQVVPFL